MDHRLLSTAVDLPLVFGTITTTTSTTLMSSSNNSMPLKRSGQNRSRQSTTRELDVDYQQEQQQRHHSLQSAGGHTPSGRITQLPEEEMKEGEGAGQPVVSTISPRRFAGDLHADPLPINSSKLATATGWYPPAPPTSATSYTFQNCPNSALNPLSRTSPSPAEGRAARDRALMPPPQVPGGGRSRSHQLTQHQSPHPCPSVSFQPSPQRQQFPIRFDDIDERAEGVREDQEEGSEYMRRELGGGEGESSGSDDEYEDKAGEHVQSAPQRRRLLEPEQMEGRGEWKLPLLERIGPAHADVEMVDVIEDMQGGKAKEEVEEIEEVQEVYYEEDREAFERQQQIEPEQVGMQKYERLNSQRDLATPLFYEANSPKLALSSVSPTALGGTTPPAVARRVTALDRLRSFALQSAAQEDALRSRYAAESLSAEEWTARGEELLKCLGGFLNKIGDNMNERIKVYARVHNELDKHSEELDRRSQVLETKKVDLLEKGKEFPMR